MSSSFKSQFKREKTSESRRPREFSESRSESYWFKRQPPDLTLAFAEDSQHNFPSAMSMSSLGNFRQSLQTPPPPFSFEPRKRQQPNSQFEFSDSLQNRIATFLEDEDLPLSEPMLYEKLPFTPRHFSAQPLIVLLCVLFGVTLTLSVQYLLTT